MSPAERLNRISEQGLCVGCGLCQTIAGPDQVRVEMTPTGYERPVIVGDIDHATVDKIYDVCPGIRVEGLPQGLVDASTQHDKVWGAYRRVVRAFASDPDIRHRASTGGVLTALGMYLLQTKRVNFILQVATSKEFPTCGERHLSFSQTDVIEATGSRYGPAAPLVELDTVLDRAEPFAFIGKPCDVAAVRNYARHDKRVDELCRYQLVMVCGGYMEPKAMRRFLEEFGVPMDDLSALRYRGFGCPGPTRIETKDGRVVERNYLDFWGEDESAWSLPFRCNVCPDGIGEAADIAAADTWPGGSPTWEGQDDDLGTNAVIARTAAGLELMEAAAADGAITLESDITMRDMDNYQPHQVTKKYMAWARYAGLRAGGQLFPQTQRLRIRELALENGLAENLRQAKGTNKRVQNGRNCEPTPVALVAEDASQ